MPGKLTAASEKEEMAGWFKKQGDPAEAAGVPSDEVDLVKKVTGTTLTPVVKLYSRLLQHMEELLGAAGLSKQHLMPSKQPKEQPILADKPGASIRSKWFLGR